MAPSVNKSSSRATPKQNFQKKRQDQIAQGVITPQTETGTFDKIKQLGKNFATNVQKERPLFAGQQSVNDAGEIKTAPGSFTVQDLIVASAGASPGAFGGSVGSLGKGASATENIAKGTEGVKGTEALNTPSATTSQTFSELSGVKPTKTTPKTNTATKNLNKDVYTTKYILDEKGRIIGRTNTKVVKQTSSKLTSTLKSYGLAIGTIGLGIGLITQTMQTWQMNQWSQIDNANFALSQAYQSALLSGDEASLAQIEEMQKALTDQNFWSNLVPGAGLKVAADAMAIQYKMQDQLKADMETLKTQRNFSPQDQGGLSTNVTPDGRTIQNTEDTNKNFFQELKTLARQNELRDQQLYADFIREQQRSTREEEELARRAQRQEEAAFWAKERAKKQKEEDAQRKENATFWLNYKKMILELETAAWNSRTTSSNEGPSTLNFGLLQ